MTTRLKMMLATPVAAAACLLAAGVLPAADPADPKPVFVDSFDDAAVAEAGDAKDFWTASGRGTAEQVDGKLVLTTTGAEYANQHLFGPVLPELNFLVRPLTFRVDGIALGGTAAPPERQVFRFTLAPVAETEYRTLDALGLDLRGDGMLRLGYKLDTAEKDPAGANVLVQKKFDGPVTGFDLTLRPDGYTLLVRHVAADQSAATETFAGKYADAGPGLSVATWGDHAGGRTGSAIVLLAQRAPTGDDAHTATVTLDEVRVTTGEGVATAEAKTSTYRETE